MSSAPSPLSLPPNLNEQEVVEDALSRGFITEVDLQTALQARVREGRRDVYRSLLEHLVEWQALTRRQVQRLVDEAINPEREDDIPGYQFLETLGSGSMGTVHRAMQRALNRVVAVKLLSRKFARNRRYLESFARECRFSAATRSAYFPRAYDAGRARGQHYLVMEYVEGVSVESFLSGGRRMSELQTLHIAAEICHGLEHLHRLGIVHRDVKPENVVVGKDDQLRLLDLGLALQLGDQHQLDLERGAAIGTPHYISPEQASGREIDGRADLYSLGATMYHMLTGQPPFNEARTPDVFEAH
ncbi:MAG TPA: serine/threonine-protein kinase, partial [Pirellulales bacterium]